MSKTQKSIQKSTEKAAEKTQECKVAITVSHLSRYRRP